ncbi:MAG: MBOAT family protein [Nitrospinota bacterium]|nr:MBOAT family protein [Nitrospinota bacterium]
MLFTSYGYIFLFIPVTFVGYFGLNYLKLTRLAKVWLGLTSLFFYGYWNPDYLLLLMGSIVFNYLSAIMISYHRGRGATSHQTASLLFSVTANLGLLGYFKYYDFFVSSINTAFASDMELLHIVLPLGISFFTFTQIAFLVDTSRGRASEYSFDNYMLFVTFFPHLLAGPIIHHKEMMPQFDRLRNKFINHKHISKGIYLFFIGLAKKLVIADSIAVWANAGFDSGESLSFIQAWETSLAFSFQLYFDFSGYTDMALGVAMVFNIILPQNFNSPYKAADIQDFWRRWHMTLSRFLRDYVYIPLGGNRVGEAGVMANLVLTFVIGGLWHGAGWTFILWGLMHGVALVIHRIWKISGMEMNRYLGVFVTFMFVNAAWVLFRAPTFDTAIQVYSSMLGLNGFSAGVAMPMGYLKTALINILSPMNMISVTMKFIWIPFCIYSWIPICMAVVFLMPNSTQMISKFNPGRRQLVFIGAVMAFLLLRLSTISEFIYYQF